MNKINLTGNTFTISNKEKRQMKYLLICEDIRDGHNINGLSVFADGRKIYEGKCIGYKRIIPLGNIAADELKIEAKGTEQTPKLKYVSVY